MMKHFSLVLLALALTGCGRSPTGVYQSTGDEDKFRMTLEVASGGQARFATRSNLGNPEVDRAVEASMSLENARWSQEGPGISVVGTAKDGKPVTYRFTRQENGDLIWDKTGARLVRK